MGEFDRKCTARDVQGYGCMLPVGHDGGHCNPMRNPWPDAAMSTTDEDQKEGENDGQA